MDIFVGRQPIFDTNKNIFGYELLYRNSTNNAFPDEDPDVATLSLLVNTYFSIGMDTVSDKGLSFINFTGSLLAQDIFSNLDPKRVVIEILEDVELTPTLISKLRELKKDGFKLAMDDFILQDQYEVNDSFFNMIDYIKVDFQQSNLAERLKIEAFTKKHPHIILIAEKVETVKEYNYAKKSGYTLFQGYYFAKPEIISGYEIPQRFNLYFQIIEKLNETNPNIDEISSLIKRDVSLSYKLLRFINSPGIGVPQKISSIKQAIVLIGLKEMKKWMHVLSLRDFDDKKMDGRIQALIDYSLVRAKLCENLAKRVNQPNAEEYFLVGMFSLIDVIFGRSLESILPLLPLSERVTLTLQGIETGLTPALKIAEGIERFDWEMIENEIPKIDISFGELCTLSHDAIKWSQSLD